MTPSNILIKLRVLGYSITYARGSLKLIYRGDGSPPKKRAIPLIEILRTHKEEILSDPHFLIDLTVQEINKGWEAGTLKWMKTDCPHEWERSLTLEQEINKAALRKDVEALKRVLAKYEGLMLSMIGEFSSIRGDKACVHKDG